MALQDEAKTKANEKTAKREPILDLTRGGGDGSGSVNAALSQVLSKAKMAIATAQHGLFLATIANKNKIRSILIKELSESFKDALLKLSIMAITRTYYESLQIHANTAACSHNYLKWPINMPYFNATIITLIIQIAYKDTTLDKDVRMLYQVSSIFVMLAANASAEGYAYQESIQMMVDLKDTISQATNKH